MTKEKSKLLLYLGQKHGKSAYVKEIARAIGKKSYAWVFNSAKEMEKEGIILKEKMGMLSCYRINLESADSINAAAQAEAEKFKEAKLPKNAIDEVMNAVPLNYFTLLVTGSYAKGNEKKSSDLDIIVIVENNRDKKQTESAITAKCEILEPRVHAYVFSEKDFLEMLTSEEMNYGKMAAENRIIAFGAENYYKIILKAVKNGFNGGAVS